MYSFQPIGVRIKSVRVERGLSQADLAARSGLLRERLCDIERGGRTPTVEQLERVAVVLEVDFLALVRNTDWLSPTQRERFKKRSLRVSDEFTRRWVYHPPFDRDMSTQLRKAMVAYSELTRVRLERVKRRDDSDAALRLLGTMVCGSSLEVMAHLDILGRAEIVHVCPEPVGFRHHPVVDPKTRRGVGSQPHPAYRLDLGAMKCLLIPQVGLACRRTTWRVDFLGAVIDHRGRVHWFIVEIDGDGHDYGGDAVRDEDLELPVVHVSESEVLSDAFLEVLEQRVRLLLRLAA